MYDVSQQFKYKKGLFGTHKKEIRRIDAEYRYNDKCMHVHIWTSDFARADQLKKGSVIELTGDFELGYGVYEDSNIWSLDYLNSDPVFSVVRI